MEFFQIGPNICQNKRIFEQFQQLPSWFTQFVDFIVASIYGIKGTQIFKGGMSNKKIMSDNLELINEYKEQVRILNKKWQNYKINGKSKDSANKKDLQKLEHSQQDLAEANKK